MSKEILVIHSRINGFRRAGFEFSATEPLRLKRSDLKPDQIEALTNEPGLIVFYEDDVEPSEERIQKIKQKQEEDREAEAKVKAEKEAEAKKLKEQKAK
jgi:hypothetical protein